jgi:DNA end-binding protein Ku
MAPRPAWRGYLKLSLVTCAVELTNATSYGEKVSFHILSRATGNRVRRVYLDSETNEPLEEEDEVRGYEISKDEYLLVEEDEIDAIQIESTHTLALDSFVKREEVDQVYLDTPYYLTPADEVSEEAFMAIRDALASSKMAAIAHLVLYRRERPVLIEPFGKGMLVTTLRYDKTVRKADDVFDEMGEPKVDAETVELAEKIIEKKTEKFAPSKLDDPYQEALLRLINAKKSGKKAPIVKAEPPPSNVVNLFDALKKSLREEGVASKPAARSKPRSTARRRPKAGKAKPKAESGSRRKSA